MTDLSKVKTIVLVMMENRSFDHLLGWMSLPAFGGRRDVDGLTGDLDPATRELTDPRYDNYALGHRWRPFLADADAPLVSDVPHGRTQIADQLDFQELVGGFTMSGFARSYFEAYAGNRGARPDALRFFPPQLLPMTSFLARSFAVCDRWFAPLPADTQPNRMMALSGVSPFAEGGTTIPDQDTLLDWCDRHGVRWRVYHDGFSFMTLFRRSTLLSPRFVPFRQLAADFQAEADATFPQVIVVEPAYDDDPFAQHPNDNHPPLPMGPGEQFLADVYRAVTSNPDRWAGTLLLVYYDEHGGFFDHVPPLPVRTPSPAGQYPPFQTTGLRVPALVVSPFVAPGGACHQPLDHTSVLRFLGERFAADGAYSAAVSARHAGGPLGSLAAALDTSLTRAAPPPPPVGPVVSVSHSEPREPANALGRAFAQARAEAQAQQPEAVVARHPRMLFRSPLPPAAQARRPAPDPTRT